MRSSERADWTDSRARRQAVHAPPAFPAGWRRDVPVPTRVAAPVTIRGGVAQDRNGAIAGGAPGGHVWRRRSRSTSASSAPVRRRRADRQAGTRTRAAGAASPCRRQRSALRGRLCPAAPFPAGPPLLGPDGHMAENFGSGRWRLSTATPARGELSRSAATAEPCPGTGAPRLRVSWASSRVASTPERAEEPPDRLVERPRQYERRGAA